MDSLEERVVGMALFDAVGHCNEAGILNRVEWMDGFRHVFDNTEWCGILLRVENGVVVAARSMRVPAVREPEARAGGRLHGAGVGGGVRIDTNACPLCQQDLATECSCDPSVPGYYHPDLAIDAEVRADVVERDAIDRACGITPGWHKRRGIPANSNRERLLRKGSPEHRGRCRALGDFVIAQDAYLMATGWVSTTPTGSQRVVWQHPRADGEEPVDADAAIARQRRWDFEDL